MTTEITKKIEALRRHETPENYEYNDALDHCLDILATHAAEPAPTDLCGKCMGTGTAGHPDSGYTCDCNGGMSAAPTGNTAHHPRQDITDDVIAQWANDRADDAGALARRIGEMTRELSAMKADRPYIIGCLHGWDAAVEGGEAPPSVASPTGNTALVAALTLAANRLALITVEQETGTEAFYRIGEWADEARAALQPAAPQPTPEVEARPLEEWHEGMGDVVWWKFPVEEASWIGSPNGSDWPDYHTHFTPHPSIPALARGLVAEKGEQ